MGKKIALKKKRKSRTKLTLSASYATFETASLFLTHFVEDIAYCNDCKKSQPFNTDNIPEEECLEHNYVVDLYRCPKCMFTGKNYTGLKIHMNAKHKEATK